MAKINNYFHRVLVLACLFALACVIHFKSYSVQNIPLSGQNTFIELAADTSFDFSDINLIVEDDNDETEGNNNNEAAPLVVAPSYSVKENTFSNPCVSFLQQDLHTLFCDTQRKLAFLGFFVV